MSSSNSAVSNSPTNDDHSNHYQDSVNSSRIYHECKSRLMNKQKSVEQVNNSLHNNYTKAQQDIAQAYQMAMSALDRAKNELMKELDDVYNARLVSLSIFTNKIEEHSRKLDQCFSVDQTQDSKSFIDSKLQAIFNIDLDSSYHSNDLEFVANYTSLNALTCASLGYIRSSSNDSRSNMFGRTNGYVPVNNYNCLNNRFGSMSLANHNDTNRSLSSSDTLNFFSYDRWSNTNGNCLTGTNSSSDGTLFTSNWSNANSDVLSEFSSDPLTEMNNDSLGSNIMPIKSQVQRQKMIYHCKFGEFGIMEGQFTEPSGVAVNAQNDIIVADTNNHRIQIFDKDGRFKFQFGECGKRDGQLLYPNRVAVVKQSGDIIVTERSPTHQIQVYNQYGQFVRKFGADILQHPRGVTVDHKGNIIIVECKVMRVIIFDLFGNVLHKFGCSKHLEFPNGVVVNDKQEIFISDNRAHCVKVFSYSGNFLRNIGGEGLTNYPIGVCINDNGEILVADNHNNFNITIFTQEGQLVNALESKVKHSQCFDVALMDDNSVVLASKDYRIYIYRYLQLQSLATAVANSVVT